MEQVISQNHSTLNGLNDRNRKCGSIKIAIGETYGTDEFKRTFNPKWVELKRHFMGRFD